ncbi:MAG: hypothetical protein RMY28_022430 [Nostoc sp. ChiSLP01]|nr:hypothetical protein [Nostoc sp. CmiSLP01]MDZ8288851.1 hypothetical protein [Nostoc sp. ChiSLP01]
MNPDVETLQLQRLYTIVFIHEISKGWQANYLWKNCVSLWLESLTSIHYKIKGIYG